jgi:polyketide synthase PksN
MENNNFKAIIEKLRTKEISPDQAKLLLDRLKNQKKQEPSKLKNNGSISNAHTNTDGSRTVEIAVIGISGQFPDAENVGEFWDNILNGCDAVRELPQEYLDQNNYYSSKKQKGKSFCKWGGILKNRDCFDPLFFSITPKEAECMNPHQRLVMQEGWKALEDAGYNPKQLSGNPVGVFIGAEPTGYPNETFTGSSDAIIASRLSYFLNLKGPALVVNTGCSSSGVAIHLACESLRNEESYMAIAGGVYAHLNQDTLISLTEIEMITPTGKCKTFDESADGTVLSEGVGIVVLKKLENAISDGDHIYGIIKASGINQDGASNGITAPNGLSQEQLITGLYRKYGINPEDISYIETHGTGTKLGDPIEANALIRAFREFTHKKNYCILGSVKTNIGHTAAAAGVIGLIKILLCLKHKKIPGLINFNKLNPMIEMEGSSFYINTDAAEWKTENGKPLMAALNSFGHSGTNVHLVVQEYVEEETGSQISCSDNEYGPMLIPLSARSRERLQEYAQDLLAFLRSTVCERPDLKTKEQDLKRIDGILKEKIAGLVAKILLVDKEDIVYEESFKDFGVEQIHMVELHKNLEEELGFEIKAQELQREVSVASLANWLLVGYQKEIINLFCHENKDVHNETNIDFQQFPIKLSDICFTLQYGREAMEERVIFMVRNIRELLKCLENYTKGSSENDNCWQGRVKDGKNIVRIFNDDEDMDEIVKKWISKGKLDKIADLWSQGYNIDWGLLHKDMPQRRISMPTYPFEKERYWINKSFSLTEKNSQGTGNLADNGMLMFKPCWKETASNREGISRYYDNHIVILCDFDDITGEDIVKRMGNISCFAIRSLDKPIDERFQKVFEAVFERVQALLRLHKRERMLVQFVIPSGNEQQLFAGITGLFKTMELENPKFVGQFIEMEKGEEAEGLAAKLTADCQSPKDKHIRYKDNKRWVCSLSPLKYSEGEKQIPWREKGVYLITGGAGGLGLIFTGEIVQKVKEATIILTGRSPLSDKKRNVIKKLEAGGSRIVYKQVDVSDRCAVQRLFEDIHENYGKLNGIIHSAGIVMDNFIINKSKEEALKVLLPKVGGLVNLDVASKNIPLDFLVIFSSASAVLGNPGQADYASANAFMDKYAWFRNEMVSRGERYGKTLSVNWPLWKEGGMGMGEENERIIRKNTGLISLSTCKGIEALYICLNCSSPQVLVAEGQLLKMQEYFLGSVEEHDGGQKTHCKIKQTSLEELFNNPEKLKEKTIEQLKLLLSDITRISTGKIYGDELLESYGVDSIVITQLNERLASYFPELTKTLFYEYHTLDAVVEYLVSSYPKECVNWCSMEIHNTGVEENDGEEIDYGSISTVSIINNSQKANEGLDNNHKEGRGQEPIAIIGISGRFPKARTVKEFWNNLQTGRDCITDIPEERWSLEGFYEPDVDEAVFKGKSYCKSGGFIDGFADFDAQFFNISPREAINMDPQERIFMEACWGALEDAGYTREQLKVQFGGKVGVFAGITKNGYNLYGPEFRENGEKLFPYTSFGSIANRVSYFLDINGPSMPVDTMCSSSLTAVHEACRHIISRECEMAFAGGVNLYLHPSSYTWLCSQRMLSVDGRCKSFGKGGNGFVPGEGTCAVLLKRLSRAIEDRDHIYAVIRSTSINHGGKTNGYTVPSPVLQGELIRDALNKAGVNAREVSYIEAHGTGTELGDPIEITGLTQAFGKDTRDTGFCAIGSVKSNIGHLEAAAGMAGLAKIILQMKHGKIAPSLFAKELNPNINFDRTPFVVCKELVEWKRPLRDINGKSKEIPRIAGISSFGAGGANAHAVLEEYIAENDEDLYGEDLYNNPMVIVLSAKNEKCLEASARQLLNSIREGEYTDRDLMNMAYTLQLGREPMEERLGFVAGSLKELEVKLEGFINNSIGQAHIYRGRVVKNKRTSDRLSSDKEMDYKLDECINKGNFELLAQLWVKGAVINWSKLYTGLKPGRISLPTYPFAGEKYWPVKTENSMARKPQEHIAKPEAVVLSPIDSNTSEQIENPEKGIFNKASEKLGLISLKALSECSGVIDSKTEQCQPVVHLSPTEFALKHTEGHNVNRPVPQEKSYNIEVLQEELIKSLAKALYMSPDDVDPDKEFVEMGLDSVVGVEWIQTVNKQYNTTIAATKVYDYPTIHQFVLFLKKELDRKEDESVKGLQVLPVKKHEIQPEPAVREPEASIRVEVLQEELTESFAKALYMKPDEVDPDKEFVEMGLDSVVGVEWIQTINKKYGTAIAATKVYDYPNIRLFAEFLKNELKTKEEKGKTVNLKHEIPSSLDDLLEQVKQGSLDINQADRILDQLNFEEEEYE